MKMRISGEYLQVIEVDQVQAAILKSWNGVISWNRKTKMWNGRVSMELLNRMAGIIKLPDYIEAERIRMNKVQEAVDQQRTLEPDKLKPLSDYPVTKQLYKHQIRAANMALLTFGLTDWKEALECQKE